MSDLGGERRSHLIRRINCDCGFSTPSSAVLLLYSDEAETQSRSSHHQYRYRHHAVIGHCASDINLTDITYKQTNGSTRFITDPSTSDVIDFSVSRTGDNNT